MLAIYVNPLTPYDALFGIALAGYSLFASICEYRRRKRVSWLHLSSFVALTAIVTILLFFPPIARISPQYRDAQAAATLATSKDPEARRNGIHSLCEILRSRPANQLVRDVVFQALTEARATEAVPLLRELCNDDDADLQSRARNALEKIER